MEVIASLSIVASAAAGDATTLNIVALALANLIGGVFVIGHNLWDLKDDCYKFSTQQTSNDQEARTKYKELLGSVEHFPLHAFFAILSFLVFGIIPPVAYGYAFHETNDRDFTMVVVAVASFVCVGLLAIFKAYIDRCTEFSGYVKTITYYLTTAVAVSGVSYAVGNLVERLIEELGLFETSSNVSMAVIPEVVSMNPSVAYY
ncbi:putative Ccc1 family protein [Helianthus annuus]|nr:putative Ccc1 family protein [Helianthus annuus]